MPTAEQRDRLRAGHARLTVVLAAAMSATMAPAAASAADQVSGRPVIGLAERVLIDPGGFELRAKIDTGADLSSIYANDLEIVERDGRRRAIFEVVNAAGQRLRLDRLIIRSARIKQTGTADPQLRPVVRLAICLDGVRRSTRVSLADRKGFDYQLLLGVDFLAGHFVVDPARSMTREPRCPPSGSR